MTELPDGYRVRYKHIRLYARGGIFVGIDDMYSLEPKGGETIATVVDLHGDTIGVGYSRCRPDENYNKRLGRTIALGRALQDLEKHDNASRND